MSDIPLQTFRRSRAKGYTRLNDREHHLEPQAGSGSSMPRTTVSAAISSSSERRLSLLKGKRKERYSDDPEEQANLLGNDQLDQDRYDVSDQTVGGRRTPVRKMDLLIVCLAFNCDGEQLSPVARKSLPIAKDKSRNIPFRPPGAHHFLSYRPPR